MDLLRVHYQAEIDTLEGKTMFTRLSTRSIALRGEEILLLYTARYDDYSLPGGGLDDGEDIVDGMKRELVEETGAQNIRDIQPFGVYEEYRVWHKPDFDIQKTLSYCYTCTVDEQLGANELEDYEQRNGMVAKWMNIHEAIAHNKHVFECSEKKGISIEREIFMLELIAKKLLK